MSAVWTTARPVLRRWYANGSGPSIAELDLSRNGDIALLHDARRLATALEGCASLVLRVTNTGRETIDPLIRVLAQPLPTKICVAIRADDLRRFDSANVNLAETGIVLDDVNEASALAEFLNPDLQGLRVAESFVANAATDLKTDCVLESVLNLAHELGLPTFGPRRRDSGRQFDYLPELAARRPMRRAAAGGSSAIP